MNNVLQILNAFAFDSKTQIRITIIVILSILVLVLEDANMTFRFSNMSFAFNTDAESISSTSPVIFLMTKKIRQMKRRSLISVLSGCAFLANIQIKVRSILLSKNSFLW